ncbi:DMT family transporter [Wolbachia endosymbiont of Ctenocephalides felis wCfeT]|uniref:DMT family transporter n=1 Tax=Wolbachia endosymbiont of Ctenocephalides felis wCfeT TaxID=2732593 RepID=UPI00144650C2|nr:multidrug efflux SMR transporter [Wolbachia endosymbiont of Ctenocephalides felis wCfeT]
MDWLYLLLSAVVEIFWVLTLKSSAGFTELIPSILNILTMTFSTYLLSLATRSIPIGVCYSIWTGVGAVGASILGIYLFDEPSGTFEMICFTVIILGVIGLKVFETAPDK